MKKIEEMEIIIKRGITGIEIKREIGKEKKDLKRRKEIWRDKIKKRRKKKKRA